MAKKKTEPIEKLEREYIIPLRNKWKKVPRYKRVNKAIKTIKEFLVRHMGVGDRDLDKVKLDKYLNEFVWARGIRKPPIKIKVRAIKEGDIVRAELSELPEKMKFKKLRKEKIEQKAMEIVKSKKKTLEKIKEGIKPEEKTEEKKEEEKKEEKEKAKAVEEAGKEMGKAAAKQVKHGVEKIKQPKRQQRKALAK